MSSEPSDSVWKPTEEELAEARAWRHANFPGIRDEPSSNRPEGLAQLPHLTERELLVLLTAIEARQRLPIGVESETGRILWSLHTAVSEAMYAAQRETARLREMADE